MNDDERRRYETFVRIDQFGKDNAVDFPAGKLPGDTFLVITNIVNQLQAGELDLFQAAAWFRHVNQERPHCSDRAWLLIQGDSDEEKQCRQVISWARSYFEDSMPPSERAVLMTKLEGQLSDRLCERDRIELPSW